MVTKNAAIGGHHDFLSSIYDLRVVAVKLPKGTTLCLMSFEKYFCTSFANIKMSGNFAVRKDAI